MPRHSGKILSIKPMNEVFMKSNVSRIEAISTFQLYEDDVYLLKLSNECKLAYCAIMEQLCRDIAHVYKTFKKSKIYIGYVQRLHIR